MLRKLLGMRGLWIVALAVLAVLSTGSVAMAQEAAAAPASGGAGGLTTLFVILDYLVIVVLVAASIAGVALAVDAAMNIRDSKIAPVETTEHLRSLINSRQFKELLDFTANDQSYVSYALNAGLRRAHLGYPAMREATESAAGEKTAGYFRRIEFLNIIGNMGPLIGLLGTVLGMIIAFYAMQAKSGNPNPADLAGGIATALWHTFGGLFVAIPCLVVFGFYRTKIDRITTHAAMTVEELLESLRPADGKSAVGGEAAAKPAPRRAAAVPSPAAEAAE